MIFRENISPALNYRSSVKFERPMLDIHCHHTSPVLIVLLKDAKNQTPNLGVNKAPGRTFRRLLYEVVSQQK